MPQPRAIVLDQGGVNVGLNTTVSTIAKARIVKKSITAVDGVEPLTDGAAQPWGVTMAAIESGFGGDVQIARRALVEVSVPVTIGQKLKGAAGGKAAIAGAGDWFLGEAASAGAADGAIVECDIEPGKLPA